MTLSEIFTVFVIAIAALALAAIISKTIYKLFNRPTNFSERRKVSGSIGR